MVKKQHLEHLQLINQYWQDVFSNLLLLNKTDSDELVDDISPYIVQLATLPISKKSVFRDMLWDFDEDTSNRAPSVSISKVQLDFSDYSHIPLGVITELKCLFLSIYSSPKEFGSKKNELKPNTLIAPFKNGLRFLNFVFSQVERRLGKEYIQEQCHKLGDITLLDFEEAAKRTKLEIVSKKRNSTGYKIFFDYLGSHKTKESIGIKCDADYEAIKKHIRRTLIKIIIRKQKNYHTLKPKTSIWLLRERHLIS